MSTHSVRQPDPNLEGLGMLDGSQYEPSSQPYRAYAAVCEAIGSTVAPAIIAVDGPTNSGKTTLATSLAEFYAGSGLHVARLPLDLFLVDRSARNAVFQEVADGGLDIADYSNAAWDQARYRSYLEIIKAVLA